MENEKNKINPFTNQPVIPAPTPTPSLQGEIKKISPEQKEAKSDKPVSKFDFKIVFLYLILLGLGIILAKYAFDFFVPGHPKPTGQQPQKSVIKAASHPFIKLVPKKQPATTITPAPAAAKKEEQPFLSIKKKINQTVTPYVLSGIFSSGDKSYCIINDKILEQGDLIENAKVTRISLDEVELQLNEKSIKLNLRGK